MTQDECRRLFDYREDGNLYWRIRSSAVREGVPAGSVKNHGYREIKIRGVFYRAHRLVFLWHHGRMPSLIDHINQVRTDNRIENLREVTLAENQWNRRGCAGVYRDKRSGKWRAHIRANGPPRHLGTFETEEAARAAYSAAKSARDSRIGSGR